jgi:ATP-dependent helicase/nuclease subunit A
MQLWLRRRGHAPGECSSGAARAQAALQATLASDAGRWLLTPRAEAAAELALASDTGEGLVTQVVDRTFIEDGERWIVDYKSAQVEGDDALLAAHAEAYRPQLERYARLFAGEGRPLRLAIFYAASGRLVELR